MSKQTDAIGAGTGISVPLRERVAGWRERAERGICLLDARMRTLVAATGFAALLVAILKSGTVKNLLTDIVKQALNVA